MKLRNILGVSALTLFLGVSVSGVSASADGQVSKPSPSVPTKVTADNNLIFKGVKNVSGNGDITINGANGDTAASRSFSLGNNIATDIVNNTGHDVNTKLTASIDTKDGSNSVKSNLSSNDGKLVTSSDNILGDSTIKTPEESGGADKVNQNLKGLNVQIDPNAQISNQEKFNTTVTWTLTNAQEPTNNGGQK